MSYTIIKIYERGLCSVQTYLMFSQGNLRSLSKKKKEKRKKRDAFQRNSEYGV